MSTIFKGTLGISPSDCATILNENPYRTRHELYRKKLGIQAPRKTDPTLPKRKETASAIRGKSLEPIVRRMYEERTGFTWPQSGGSCPFAPLGFLRCRLDGYCQELDAILEIKAGNLEEHKATLLTGIVPRRYYIQVQAALFITATNECHYLSYCPNEDGVAELVVVIMKPNLEFVLHVLLPALLEFYQLLINRTPPV